MLVPLAFGRLAGNNAIARRRRPDDICLVQFHGNFLKAEKFWLLVDESEKVFFLLHQNYCTGC